MIVQRPITTADELLALPRDGFCYELVEGELRQMPPAGEEHGRTTTPISAYLYLYVKSKNLGSVYGAETGFILARDPDTVLAPDTAFVSSARMGEVRAERGFARGAPDLVVEVVSPSESATDVEEKTHRWLDGGARMVIVVRPPNRTVTVHRSRQEITILSEQDTLSGDDVISDWRLPVSQVFEQT